MHQLNSLDGPGGEVDDEEYNCEPWESHHVLSPSPLPQLPPPPKTQLASLIHQPIAPMIGHPFHRSNSTDAHEAQVCSAIPHRPTSNLPITHDWPPHCAAAQP